MDHFWLFRTDRAVCVLISYSGILDSSPPPEHDATRVWISTLTVVANGGTVCSGTPTTSVVGVLPWMGADALTWFLNDGEGVSRSLTSTGETTEARRLAAPGTGLTVAELLVLPLLILVSGVK